MKRARVPESEELALLVEYLAEELQEFPTWRVVPADIDVDSDVPLELHTATIQALLRKHGAQIAEALGVVEVFYRKSSYRPHDPLAHPAIGRSLYTPPEVVMVRAAKEDWPG